MTIFKTQAKKQEKTEGGIKVVPQPLPKEDVEEGSVKPPPPVGVILAARRRTRLTNTCIIISLLMVFAISVVGGIYLYRHFARGPYVGTCGVRYEHTQVGLQRFGVKSGYMEERVEIDRSGLYERIEVPEFDECNRAVVLHEFVKNLTAIVDHNAGHCFVMPLNRREVRPPKDFWDLISKLRSGYYMPDSRIVRYSYKVVKPAISDPSIFGPYIASECDMLDTYRLKKRKRPEHEHRNHFSRKFEHRRQKRSTKRRQQNEPVKYGFFGGVTTTGHAGVVVELEINV